MWNELVRAGYVKSVQIYVNQNDPVPPFSLALGDLFVNFPEHAALFNPDALKRIINETSPRGLSRSGGVQERQRLYCPIIRQDGARNLASR